MLFRDTVFSELNLVSCLPAQFVKLVSLPSWRQISSALDVTSRFTRRVHSSASGQLWCSRSGVFENTSECTEPGSYQHQNSPFFSRADKTLQDIVYKLVPGLFKGKITFSWGYCEASSSSQCLFFSICSSVVKNLDFSLNIWNKVQGDLFFFFFSFHCIKQGYKVKW